MQLVFVWVHIMKLCHCCPLQDYLCGSTFVNADDRGIIPTRCQMVGCGDNQQIGKLPIEPFDWFGFVQRLCGLYGQSSDSSWENSHTFGRDTDVYWCTMGQWGVPQRLPLS